MAVRRYAPVPAVSVMLVLSLTSAVSAQYGDIQRLLFRGLEYSGNYNYLLQPQNGPLFNYNRFTQAVQYNRAAQGYTYESYKFFGPDSFGNANTLDLGPLRVELGGDPALGTNRDLIGLHTQLGYSTRLIPEVFFEGETGQRSYNQFSGISSFSPAPLHYRVSLNTGVEDLEWSGNALINTSGRLNALGFYDFTLRLTNVGNYEADGVVLKDEQVTDFDLGPIDVSGNIFLDAMSGLLQAVGLPAGATPARVLSGASSREKQVDELLAKVEGGGTLTNAEWQYLLQQMIEAAYQADPLGVMLNGLPAEVPGFEGLSLSLAASSIDEVSSLGVPEPGTLGLCALAFGSHFLRRRRRRP